MWESPQHDPLGVGDRFQATFRDRFSHSFIDPPGQAGVFVGVFGGDVGHLLPRLVGHSGDESSTLNFEMVRARP
jgi:hypothetical protein